MHVRSHVSSSFFKQIALHFTLYLKSEDHKKRGFVVDLSTKMILRNWGARNDFAGTLRVWLTAIWFLCLSRILTHLVVNRAGNCAAHSRHVPVVNNFIAFIVRRLYFLPHLRPTPTPHLFTPPIIQSVLWSARCRQYKKQQKTQTLAPISYLWFRSHYSFWQIFHRFIRPSKFSNFIGSHFAHIFMGGIKGSPQSEVRARPVIAQPTTTPPLN